MKTQVKAIRIVQGITTEYTAEDCKILNKIAKLLIKFGAVSSERLGKITGYQGRTINWALWHLEAEETPAQLFILRG